MRPRERSIEHIFLTSMSGTPTPPHGFPGAIRKRAYRRHNEGLAAPWLLLLAADRVDAQVSHLRSFRALRPDNPITQRGAIAESSPHPITARVEQNRAD